MLQASVIGASGYTGMELAKLLHLHPGFSLQHLYVSAGSADKGSMVDKLYGQWAEILPFQLEPIDTDNLTGLAQQMDVIFLATPHEFSHDWIHHLCGHKAVIIDLSGAFRIKDTQVFEQFYGFAHTQSEWLSQAVYGLAEWYADEIASANLIAVPGCYPTATLTALKPLQQAGLLLAEHRPVVNAVSGVSGAGRKAAINNSFCEVSLQAYGVLGHRHTPEIESWLGHKVIFTPHLGNFKRGILATITVKLADSAAADAVNSAYTQAYHQAPLVRLRNQWPKIDDVAHSPFCDLHWKLAADSHYLVVTSAIDNLLKGAAAQALQCANLRFGLPAELGLLPGVAV